MYKWLVGEHLRAFFFATLASSCCWIQLLLNALKFGCAGFSVLSPHKPFFLAVTAISTIVTVINNAPRRSTRRGSARLWLSWLRTCVFITIVVAISQMDVYLALPSNNNSSDNNEGTAAISTTTAGTQFTDDLHAKGLICRRLTVNNVFCAGCFNAATGLAEDFIRAVGGDGPAMVQSSFLSRGNGFLLSSRWDETNKEATFRVALPKAKAEEAEEDEPGVVQNTEEISDLLKQTYAMLGKTQGKDFEISKLENC